MNHERRGYRIRARLSSTAAAPLCSERAAPRFASAKSHFTVARPLPKKHWFGATFFVTQGFDAVRNKRDYMTWEHIASLSNDGCEIGNYARSHARTARMEGPRRRLARRGAGVPR
jgi:hypothetical protein